MSLKEFSNTRTKATWKPRVNEDDLPLYECADSHLTFLGLGDETPSFLSEPGRNPVFNLPYSKAAGCVGEDGEKLSNTAPARLIRLEELPEGVFLDYSIVGGYNNNAIEVKWVIDNPSYSLQWVALKTFTGMQVKYVTPKKRSPLIFALADEDAYVYCDESPCLECIFMCKRGFVLYAHVNGLGTVKLPLTRASAYWESRS